MDDRRRTLEQSARRANERQLWSIGLPVAVLAAVGAVLAGREPKDSAWLLLAIGAAFFVFIAGCLALTAWWFRKAPRESRRTPPLMRGLPYSERRSIMRSIRHGDVSTDPEQRFLQIDTASWFVKSAKYRLIGVIAAVFQAVRSILRGGGWTAFGIALLIVTGALVAFAAWTNRRAARFIDDAGMASRKR